MSINLIPSEIICIIADELDNNSLMNFSLTSKFIYGSLIKNINERKKIKKVCDTMSNEELEKFVNSKEKFKDTKMYFYVLQDRKDKGISLKKEFYTESGKIRHEEWYLHDKTHRPATRGPARIKYYDTGQIRCKVWFQNGLEGGLVTEPSIVFYHENGNIEKEEWCVNNVLHRPLSDGPARIEYYENGKIKSKQWVQYGKFNRPLHVGPAIILYHQNGKNNREEWYQYGKINRPLHVGPAIILYHQNGKIKEEQYWVDGKYHRPQTDQLIGNEPAGIEYYEDGQIKLKIWALDGKWHRPTSGPNGGPAYIEYYQNGEIKKQKYYENGNLIHQVYKN